MLLRGYLQINLNKETVISEDQLAAAASPLAKPPTAVPNLLTIHIIKPFHQQICCFA